MNEPDNPSRMVVKQRVRNRTIEALELARSYKEQREYQRNVPFVSVPDEVVCIWGDWYVPDVYRYEETIYSVAEQAAMQEFDAVVSAICEDFPKYFPRLEDLIGTEPWERLKVAAEKALEVFMIPGEMSCLARARQVNLTFDLLLAEEEIPTERRMGVNRAGCHSLLDSIRESSYSTAA